MNKVFSIIFWCGLFILCIVSWFAIWDAGGKDPVYEKVAAIAACAVVESIILAIIRAFVGEIDFLD